MTRKRRGGSSFWWWGAGGTVGLAFVVAAAMLAWSSGPGAPVVSAQTETPTPTATSTPTETPTATATATPNEGCILDINKSDSPKTVPEGGQITYTIRVENEGTQDCEDIDVTDRIPNDTDCVSASVESAPSGFDIEDVDIDGCDASGDVRWDFGTGSDEELDPGDDVVLEMVVELTSGADEGDDIENEACVDATGEIEVCDDETTSVGAPATPTATGTPVATATTFVLPPPTPRPPIALPPAPEAGIAPVVAPATGGGSASRGGGMAHTLALALGLTGGAVLLAGGAAGLWVRRVR
jgi:uncharacterized repeat protein (TIGR01451 family)